MSLVINKSLNTNKIFKQQREIKVKMKAIKHTKPKLNVAQIYILLH